MAIYRAATSSVGNRRDAVVRLGNPGQGFAMTGGLCHGCVATGATRTGYAVAGVGQFEIKNNPLSFWTNLPDNDDGLGHVSAKEGSVNRKDAIQGPYGDVLGKRWPGIMNKKPLQSSFSGRFVQEYRAFLNIL